MEYLVGAAMGVAASLAAWAVIRFVRPRLVLSSQLCVNPEGYYCLKVLNRGSRKVSELQVFAIGIRGSGDHRYPDMMSLSTATLKPNSVPVLLHRASRLRKEAGLSWGRVVRFVEIEGLDGLGQYFAQYPHASVLVHVFAVDPFSGTRVVASKMYSAEDVRKGVFGRDGLEVKSST